MEHKNNLLCLYCEEKLDIEKEECPTCGALIKEMLPEDEPDEVSKPFEFKWYFPLILPFISLELLFFLFVMAACLMGFWEYCFGLELSGLTFCLSWALIFTVIYAIYTLIYFAKKRKYKEYLIKKQLFETFVVNSEEYKERESKREAEEIEELRKIREQEKQRREEWEKKKQIEDKKRNDLEYMLSMKYGPVIDSYKGVFYLFRLYENYLVLIDEKEIMLKEEIYLSGFSDVELIYEKSLNKIVLLLKYPNTQSKIDKFINGDDGKYITLNWVDITKDEQRIQEANKFFMSIKRMIDKN